MRSSCSSCVSLTLGFAVLALCPLSASAQGTEALDEVTGPFKQCGAIADSTQRLACFDAALAALPTQQAQITQRTREERLAGFGLRDDEISPAGETGLSEALAATEFDKDSRGNLTIASKVAEVYEGRGGRRLIILENGQIWRESSNTTFRGLVRDGWTARIKRSGFGGYRMKFDGKTGFVSVKRVR